MPRNSSVQTWSRAGMMFAAIAMMVGGAAQVLQGLAVLGANSLVTTPTYLYSFNTTVWAWVHVGIGAAVFLTGIGLVTGSMVARAIGVFVAAVALLSNFLFLPQYPAWSIVLIVVDAFVIWSLATAGRRGMGHGHGAHRGEMEERGEWEPNRPHGGRYENVKEETRSGRESGSGREEAVAGGSRHGRKWGRHHSSDE